MLPTTASKGRGAARSSPPLFGPYLRRIVKWQQMDIEYTFWQMVHLCTSPKVVHNLLIQFKYALVLEFHPLGIPETKNQWARDDPAFVVILILFLVFATSAYCAAYGESASHAALTITSVVFFHFLFAGIVLATLCWFLTNSYLREEPNSHVVEQRVEWLYAFDVHCNSFFPAFVILYVLPFLDRTTFFLYPIGVVIILSPLMILIGFNPTRYFLSLYFG
ncbi:hypothetical protein C2845_PM04G10830 [Panicum miliaceum]|uniref:UNC-50 family protein n=1 Tax=Panicum miliaceum TaxID=4540 RepID=A0A3L6QLU2_PANMI|nr:hypothetical protein C2845_PM04G10830 [Panicum miliaceum]